MQHKINSEKPKDNIALQALSMAFGTFSSRILGLIRDQAFAAMFSRTVTDAWTVAFRLPNLFRRLLGEGSLSVSFIPVFVEAKEQDPSGVRARNLVNSFYTVLLLLLTVLTALGVIYSEQIVGLMTRKEFAMVPGKFELTVRMAQIMFCFIFFMSTYAFFMGILNSFGRFGLAGAAPALFNVAMIIANFVPKEMQRVEGDALAWGVVVGGFLQMVILVPSLVRLGFLPKLSMIFGNADANRVWKNMLPGMLGMGLMQITTVINTQFASSLGEGPLTHLYLADRLLELPLSLISVSLGTALLPTLARLWTSGERGSMISTANKYFRLNLYTALPAAFGLFWLAQPIVQLLFMRHRFTAQDALATASIVSIYGFTVIAASGVRVLVPSFYAIKNTKLPAIASFVALVVHILLAPVLMSRWGVSGLVISTMVGAFLNLTLLFIAHHFLIGPFGITLILRSLAKMLIPLAALRAVILLYAPLFDSLGGWMGAGQWARLIAILVIVGAGAGVYLGISYWVGIEEMKTSFDMVTGKLKRKFLKK